MSSSYRMIQAGKIYKSFLGMKRYFKFGTYHLEGVVWKKGSMKFGHFKFAFLTGVTNNDTVFVSYEGWRLKVTIGRLYWSEFTYLYIYILKSFDSPTLK